MRTVWIVAVLALSLVGCSKKGNKPIEPADVTPEQVEADVKNQKEAAAAESGRQLSSPKTGQAAAENSERRRQGGAR